MEGVITKTKRKAKPESATSMEMLPGQLLCEFINHLQKHECNPPTMV